MLLLVEYLHCFQYSLKMLNVDIYTCFYFFDCIAIRNHEIIGSKTDFIFMAFDTLSHFLY